MASAAQIAWRKEFARRAKAGTLKKNPLSRVKLNSPSMATGEAPSKRLKKRRKATQNAPEGYYANPAAASRDFYLKGMNYVVRGNDVFLAAFPTRPQAVEYGQMLADKYPSRQFAVMPVD